MDLISLENYVVNYLSPQWTSIIGCEIKESKNDFLVILEFEEVGYVTEKLEYGNIDVSYLNIIIRAHLFNPRKQAKYVKYSIELT